MSSRVSPSTIFGSVTTSLLSESIARVMVEIAPLFRAQDLRAIPLFTSQEIIESMFFCDCSEPSITRPKPPFITSPQPTPPPL